MPRGQKTQYSPVILPLVRCAAHFGATADEIANYLGISTACFYKWRMNEPELIEALKRHKRNSDERVIESLYKRALAGDVTACIFWLKNRLPSEWRDVQNINADVGHYIISDRPMTEEQWIAERTKVIEHKANSGSPDVDPGEDDTAKPLE